MASGIIGVGNSSMTLTYTPATNAKVFIVMGSGGSNSSSLFINGQARLAPPMWATSYNFYNSTSYTIWVGAGQTLTLTAGSPATYLVSVLEE